MRIEGGREKEESSSALSKLFELELVVLGWLESQWSIKRKLKAQLV